MTKIIIDANFVISLIDAADSCHRMAVQIANELERSRPKLLLNNILFYEILTVLRRKGHQDWANWFYRRVKDIAEVIYVDKLLEEKVFFYFAQTKIKDLSFADCSLFATADLHQIKNIISFDQQLKCVKGFKIINDPKHFS